MIETEQKEVLLRRIAELEQEIHLREGDLIHDTLTGLKTRAFFEEELDMYLGIIASTNTSRRKEWFGFKNISVVLLDIDDFKSINDTYGHASGDTVLKDVSKTIIENVREGDTVARWGGEEIVVLLLGSSESDALIKAESIREKIEELSFDFDQARRVTVSMGVVSAEAGSDSKELFNRADRAMYKAKDAGKNKVIAYSTL